jgi:glycyl-tRNA synthetase (class II)
MARASIDGLGLNHASFQPETQGTSDRKYLDLPDHRSDHDYDVQQDYDDDDEEEHASSPRYMEEGEQASSKSSRFGICAMGKWSRGDLYSACDALGGF